MSPIDYSIDVATPLQSAMQGYQFGMGIRDDQQKQAALVQQQAAAQQQQQVIRSLVANPNAGAQDYANAALLVPGMHEQLKQSWDTKSAAQQQTHLNEVGQYYAAIKSGSPQVAADLMTHRADALEASGAAPQEIQALRAQAQAVSEHPEFARTMMGMMLSSLPGGDKVIAGAAALGGDQRAEDLAPAAVKKANAEAVKSGVDANVAVATLPAAIEKPIIDNKNVLSQIAERSAKLGIDRDRLTSETQTKLLELNQKFGEMPEYVAKDVNSATTSAIASAQSADKMRGLADQIDKAAGELGGGVSAKTGELWKRTFGDQNELSRIRSEYSRIVTPAAMAAYKQVASGSTSDKDIETAMIGVPSDTASPDTMAAFLRGAAKLQTYSAVLDNAKSEWLAANKNLGKTKSDLEIDGTKVPAGATFKTFVDSYLPRKIEQANAATLVDRLAKKYGPQAAVPAAAVPASPVLGD